MKKIIYATLIAATGLILAACQPMVIQGPSAGQSVSASALESSFKIDGQFADEACKTPQADGNFIKFHTEPAVTVQISNLKADGSKNLLYTGASGVFNITPKRGNPSLQNFSVSTINPNSSIVSFDSSVSVFVPSELEPGVKLLAGDSGFKVWKWYAIDGSSWGNAGYIGDPGHGAAVAKGEVPGFWWGCRPAIDDDDNSGETFLGQLNHAGGTNYGDGYVGSYMIFDEDGNCTSYKPDGSQIRKGAYTISNLDRSGDTYPYANLSTSDPAILFPFAINTGGNTAKDFDVIYIDDNLLTLVCNSSGADAWSWSECTWWRFKNASDVEAALTSYDTRAWTYSTIDGACWGNAGYIAVPGQSDLAAGSVPGYWWGCPPGDLETEQIAHSGGVAYGYGDENACMIFDYVNGTVSTFKADGTQITSSAYEAVYDWTIDGYTDAGAPAGTLKGEILYPFAINTGGTKVKDFEILYIDGQSMILINNVQGNTQWSWGECTWWRFKPVE